jgi:hypothetical protein
VCTRGRNPTCTPSVLVARAGYQESSFLALADRTSAARAAYQAGDVETSIRIHDQIKRRPNKSGRAEEKHIKYVIIAHTCSTHHIT